MAEAGSSSQPRKGRGPGRKFQKERSGNPGGLNKDQRQRRDDFSAFVRGKLCDIGEDGKPHIDAAVDAAIAAARNGSHADLELLLAYAYGRPLQRMESSVKADIRVKVNRAVRKDRPADDNV